MMIKCNFQCYPLIQLPMTTPLVLGYWKVRGLGQHLRMLLAYSGLPFTEVQYDSQEKWLQDKESLGLAFPNLPYLIDGDLKLTESTAIAKYIIKKSEKKSLLGKNAFDASKINNIIGFLCDVFRDIRALFWDKDYQNLKKDVLEQSRAKLDAIKLFIGDGQYALGYLTLADFHFAEELYYFETLYPGQKVNYSFWWKIRRHFEELPQIKKYYQKTTAIKDPFLPSFAPLNPKSSRVKLAYWGLRGRGQIPRLLLGYCGVAFEDYLYTNKDKWFGDDKLSLELNFPNLPYLIDGDYNITESGAIQRYICNRWGKKELLGKDYKEESRLECFYSIFNEISAAIKELFFSKTLQTSKNEVLKKYSTKFDDLNKSIGKNEFVMGYLTLLDFIVAEDSYYIETVYPSQYKNWPFLQRIRKNFNNLPQIIAFYKIGGFKGQFYPPNTVIKVPIPPEFET